MNKCKKMNNKGVSPIIFTLVIIILAVVFLLIFWPYLDKIRIFGDSSTEYIDGKDFDGDNNMDADHSWSSDSWDPCPCGSENGKRTISGSVYCTADYKKQNICECANLLANKYYKSKDSGAKEALLFNYYTDSETKISTCIYTVPGCKALRIQQFDFNAIVGLTDGLPADCASLKQPLPK